MTYHVGQEIWNKSTKRLGTVVEVNDREVVVRYPATGEKRNSPWGEYTDAGEMGHHFHAFAGRILEDAATK